MKSKKWRFWGVIVIAVALMAISTGCVVSNDATDESTEAKDLSKEIVYEVKDLQTMFDELDGNAMKAENNYNNKYVEIQCQIASFDSDGSYISVEPIGASEWNFTTAMCYIKDDTQKNFLMEKNIGDSITIKGKIKSVGEIVGYSIDIDEVY